MSNKIDWSGYLADVSVENLDINTLVPYDKNPRIIRDTKFKELMRDIKADPEFMVQRPVLATPIDGHIVIYAGHQRLKACKELGYTHIPTTIEDDLDQKTMLHRMILDNIHFGVWDVSKFADFLEEDLEDFGLADLEDRRDFGLDDAIRRDTDGIGEGLKNKENDRAEKEEDETHGKHIFNLIFDTLEDKEEFEVLALNLPDNGERFEDWILKQIKPMYENGE